MKRIYLTAFCLLVTVFLSFGLQEAGSLLDVGVLEYKKGQYSFAINNLRKYIQIAEDSPGKAKAYYYISLCYYFEGEYLTSLQYLNELSAKFRLSEYSGQTHFWRGLIYQNLEEWENAEESFLTYVSFIKTADLTPRAYLAAANSQVELKKYSRAKTSLGHIIKDFPKSDKYEEASVLYFYVLIQTGSYGEKEEKEFIRSWLEKLGETGKDYAYKDRFWLYGAEIALLGKDYHYAKTLLKQIDNYAAGSPSSDIALLRLYEISLALENPTEARAYLIRLANEYPESKYTLDALLAMGILDYRNGHYSDALVFFKQTARTIKSLEMQDKKDPGEKERLLGLELKSLYYQAQTSYVTGDVRKAMELFGQVIERKSFLETEAVLRLMEIYLEQKNTAGFSELIKEYDKKITAAEPVKKDRYLLFKAKYYYLIRNYKLALSNLEQIADSKQFGNSASNLKAKILIKEQKLTEALELLESNLRTAALDSKPHIAYEIMSLLFSMGKYAETAEYQDLIITYSKHLSEGEKIALIVRTRYLGGISCLQTRQYDKGIKQLKEVLLFSENQLLGTNLNELINKSYYYLGWMYYKKSAYSEAAGHFATAGRIIKDTAIAHDAEYMEAFSYFSAKNFTKAAEKFMALYRNRAPEEIAYTAYYQTAKCYENMKDKNRALELYKKLYYELPENSRQDEALFEIIKTFFEQKRLEEANALTVEFKQKYPGSPLYKRTLLMEAEAFLGAQRYSEALSSYKYYIRTFPESTNIDTALYWAGYSAVKTKDYETADEVLAGLRRDFKESSFYLNGLFLSAELYRLTSDYKKEQLLLREILKEEIPEARKKEYRKRLQIVNAVLNGYEEQEAELIIRAETGSLQAKYELALYYHKKGKKEKALPLMEQLLTAKESVYAAYGANYIADLSFTAGDYTKALELFSNTIKDYKTNEETAPEALYKIAFCYNKLGKTGSALKIITSLLKKYPASEWAQKAKELKERIESK